MQKAETVLWRSSSVERLFSDQYGNPPFQIPVPGPEMREESSVSDLGIWYAIGEAWAQLATKHLPQGQSSILDIGCSCGKLARFLALNPNVRYLGLDVFKPAIDWCARSFVLLPHFQFKHVNVASELYNPSGAMTGNQVVLPADDKSFDLVVAASLFTHLLKPDFLRYLSEVARCLKPGGRAIVSVHHGADETISGDEARIEIGKRTFLAYLKSEGFDVIEQFPNFFGQAVYVLSLTNDRRTSP